VVSLTNGNQGRNTEVKEVDVPIWGIRELVCLDVWAKTINRHREKASDEVQHENRLSIGSLLDSTNIWT
jgi:hypothetical protein